MSMSRRTKLLLLEAAMFLLGLAVFAYTPMWLTIRPRMAMDAILTPAELRDPANIAFAHRILDAGARMDQFDGWMLSATGAMIAAAALAALVLTARTRSISND